MKAQGIALQVCTVSAALCVLGCATTTQHKAEVPKSPPQAQLAARCEGAPARLEAGEGGYGRVFIQAAQVSSADLSDPLADWLANHPVRSPSVAGIVGTNGAPSSLRWNRCRDVACEGTEPWELTVTPALPARVTDPLTLAFQLRRGGSSEVAESAVVETHNQEPAVVHWSSTQQETLALVVTPYLVGDDADLRRLAECRSRSGEAGSQEPGSAP